MITQYEHWMNYCSRAQRESCIVREVVIETNGNLFKGIDKE